MQVHVGLEKFREVAKLESIEEQHFDNWLRYYKAYEDVFTTIFERMYRTDVKGLKSVITSLDLHRLEVQAMHGLEKHTIGRVEGVLQRCTCYFDFHIDFDVFMLVGFGHIDGCAPPAEKPFLYLGLERLFDVDIEFLIPHEFNHLVRFHRLKGLESMDEMTVKQLAIAEGLATLTPLMMNNEELSDGFFLRGLMISKDEYAHLKANEDLIEKEITRDLGKSLTPELMDKYFMAHDHGELPLKSGYYFGLKLILTILRQAFELPKLTKQSTEDLYLIYRECAGTY